MDPSAEVLIEVSWEVCNKVGGIHTVIQSKLPYLQKRYKEYVLIGPLLAKNPEFRERPAQGVWGEVATAMQHAGIRCSFGNWIVSGSPDVVLIDPASLMGEKDGIKHLLWERFGIDSLNASYEFDEPMCFSWAAGRLIEEYQKRAGKRTVVQCHEWMAGFALLYLAQANCRIGKVFTTHATMLGRSIMANGHDLYAMIDSLDAKEWAYRLNVQEKHLAEVACAHAADIFTTVSEITGLEAERLLGRKPDVLLYNGFYIDKFPTFEETSIRHNQSKEFLKDLTAYTFFPHYSFDLEKTIFMFTSGRYEFANKGLDVFIDSLAQLNDRLRGKDRTIVVFFWVIAAREGIDLEILENKNTYHHLKTYISWHSKPLLQQITLDLLRGKRSEVSKEFIERITSGISPVHRAGSPPLTTHHFAGEENDAVLSSLRAHGLLNREEDRVKVLFYPGFLDGSDGLLNLQYYDATIGCHLGVFPSHYEPWGYTPLESAVLGCPAITTDLAGFGRYIRAQGHGEKGVFVIERQGKRREDVVHELTEKLELFAKFTHEQRVAHGFHAKTLAGMCDWDAFIDRYIDAHNKAIGKRDA